MLAEAQDEEQIIARVAALDIGKAELVCCVRISAEGNRKKRLQEVSTHSTMTRSLAELANHLVDLRIEREVMEATSDYWKPGAAEDRRARFGLVVQGRRTADAAAQFRPACPDPPAAGSDECPQLVTVPRGAVLRGVPVPGGHLDPGSKAWSAPLQLLEGGAFVLVAVAVSSATYTRIEKPIEKRLRGRRPRPEMVEANEEAAAGAA